MKTPMLQTIRRKEPEAQIDLITDSEFGTDALLKDVEFIDNVISLPKEASLTEKQKAMQALDYDLMLIAFDACPPFLHKMAINAPIKKIIRHSHPSASVLSAAKNKVKESLWPRTSFVPLIAGRHETLLNIDLLKPCLEIDYGTPVQTQISSPNSDAILRTFSLEKNGYILIQPGAANGQDPTKTWHPNNWMETTNWLIENSDLPIVICGDDGDREKHILPIIEKIKSPRLIDTSGKTTIDDLISLVAHARLLLCHDSGTMHIADALSTDLIALFGPSDSSRTKPLRATSRILYSDTEYLNYKYNFKSFSVNDLKSGQSIHYPMSGIQTEEMIEKIKETLSEV